ncbi:pilus assembly protein PilM [Chloroflexota bacterium]
MNTEQDNGNQSEARPAEEAGKPAAKTLQSRGKSMFAGRATSITISDAAVRLTVIRGAEIEKWVTCALEPGVVVNGIVQNTDAFSAMLKGLLKDHKIKANRLIVGLSGLHAITRIVTLPHVPKKILNESILHEADRELPVPLDSVYLSWQIIEDNPEEIKVFVVAYSQNVIDPLMIALRKAGIKPYFLDLATLAITRCVNSPTSIVFDARPGELDIVVTIDNIPELSRAVPLPFLNSVEDNMPIILDELMRTITFCQSAKSIDTLPIFGFGELDRQTIESLSVTLNQTITMAYPPFYYPPEFYPDTSMVNLGLALGRMKLPDSAYSRKVNINLLPESYKEKIVTPNILMAAGAMLAVGILVAVFILFLMVSADNDRLRDQISAANQLQVQQQTQLLNLKGEESALEARAEAAASRWQKLSGSIAALAVQQASINNDLELVALNPEVLPSGVSLSSITISQAGNVSLRGQGSAEAWVLNYVRNLENSGRFSSIVLNMNRGADDVFSFTLQLS